MIEKSRWTLAELSEETGLPARTIRYYISRGLIEGPEVAGRSAVYDCQHRDRLLEIRKLQSEGRMLAEIAPRVESIDFATPQVWQHYSFTDGVVMQVRSDIPPWRLKLIQRLIAEMATVLQQEDAANGNANMQL